MTEIGAPYWHSKKTNNKTTKHQCCYWTQNYTRYLLSHIPGY